MIHSLTLLASMFVSSCAGIQAEPTPHGSERVIVFAHSNVIPMTSEVVLRDQMVVVQGGRIVETVPAKDFVVPDAAQVIDATGAYLMPGLADMHVHLYRGWPAHPLHMFLANGVTTVRDLGGSSLMPRWRANVRSGEQHGPTICGTARTIRGTEKQPADLVAKHHRQGYRSQKIYSYLTADGLADVMRETNRLGMYTVGHIPLAAGLDLCIAGGVAEVAHADQLVWESVGFDRTSKRLRDRASGIRYLLRCLGKTWGAQQSSSDGSARASLASIAKRIAQSGVSVCTTMATNELVTDRVLRPAAIFAREYADYFPAKFRSTLQAGKDRYEQMLRGHEAEVAILQDLGKVIVEELRRAGAFLVLGTDAGGPQLGTVPGFSIHDEMRLLAACGYSPFEILRMGTVHAAQVVERMHGDGSFGTIESGQRADLVLLDANPLEDVGNARRIRGVMAAGRYYGRRVLAQMIAR